MAAGLATALAIAPGSVLGQSSAGRAAPPAAADERRPSQNPVKDGWITFKIHSQFVPDNVLEGSNIDVDTAAGVVTLTGTVPSAAAETRAIALAKATDGVKSVNAKLRVAPPTTNVGNVDTSGAKAAAKSAGRSVNDGWIKSKIYAQFLTDWSVFEDSDIDIDVTNGVVALNGTVKSEAAKTRAAALAKSTDGVKTVKDNLKIRAS